MQSKPTNVLIKQIELKNLGYIKKTSFGRRKYDGVIETILMLKVLIKTLLDRNEEKDDPFARSNIIPFLVHVAYSKFLNI